MSESNSTSDKKTGISFRTRNIAISAVVLVCAVGIALIVTIAILFSQLSITNTNLNNLTNQVNGVTTPQNSVALCTTAQQVNIYTQLVTAGNYCVQTTTPVLSGATVQRGGVPAVILCNSLGSGQAPIYLYISASGNPVTNSYGTSLNPPSGFNLGKFDL